MHVSAKAENGGLLVKDGLVAAFFLARPYGELAQAFGEVFEEWLKRTPAEARKWASVGPSSEEFKPVSPKLLQRGRAEFEPKRVPTRKLSCLELIGPDKVNPDFRFFFLGSRELQGTKTNLLEIRFPSSAAEPEHVEGYVQFVSWVAGRIPYDSGYASLALTMGADSQQGEFRETVRKWAFRYPGFDVARNDGSRQLLGKNVRGAYWLTFVGPDGVAQLGGETALRRKLPREIGIQKAGRGLMVRASQLPEVGDVNRRDNLPTLRAVAKVLEPATLFEDNFLEVNFMDEHARSRWERRHLD